MECNKDEAVRAKEIAERKMQNGDFEDAKKFALKAQKLFPELENLSQLFAVCDVHCSSKHKVHGSEMDWYGILQVEIFTDENSIKKQYRKLALLLHPDKNKFAGAEAAFKLIGEANRILMDQRKRSEYDFKCRNSVRTAPKPTPKPKPKPKPTPKTTHQSNKAASTNNVQNGYSKFTTSYPYQQAQHLSFWTNCNSCGMKYQYHKELMNKLLCCASCGSPFIARDLGSPVFPGGCHPVYNKKDVQSQGPCNEFSQCNGGEPSFSHFSHRFAGSDPILNATRPVQVGDFKKQEKVGVHTRQPHEAFVAEQQVNGSSNLRDGKKGSKMPKPNVAKAKESKTSRTSKKRGRSVEKSEGSGSDTEVKNVFSQEGCGNNGGHQPRRSLRQKHHVHYEEKFVDDDDDFVSSLDKRPKVATHANANEEKIGENAPKKSKIEESKGKEEEPIILDDAGSGSSINANPSPQLFEYPDPEFCDFEMHKAENCFAVNQVWAIYDTLDGMPRFYARIKKVFTPGFKLQITWLEADPDGDSELNWVDADMPVSCGKYSNGSSEECEDRLMFSHRIDLIKSSKRKGSFLVYPRKGETWALYRDWDLEWALEPEKHKPPYQYDFVEVLTDFNEEIGIGVAHLGKVGGFVSIFQKTERDGVISFQVSPREVYRFSHQIPSFKMTGKEKEGVPVGSFELDPASLPTKLDELVDHCDMKMGSPNIDKELNHLRPKLPQNQVKATIASEKSHIEREASAIRRSLSQSNGQIGGDQYKGDDNVKHAHDSPISQPKESASSGDTGDQKINNPNKCKKTDRVTDCLTARRSPRHLDQKSSQGITSGQISEKDKKEIHDSNLTEMKACSTSVETSDQKINTPNKSKKDNLTKYCSTPRRSPRGLSKNAVE